MIIPGPNIGAIVEWNQESWTIKRFLGGKVLLWLDGKRDKQVWVNAKFIADIWKIQEEARQLAIEKANDKPTT